MKWNSNRRTHRGYTLIEVLIGILIFAVGMMALAKLQGNLARNSGDSNARTVATNIAEEVIETSRNFVQVTSDGSNSAYNDIVDGTETIIRSGNQYTVVTDVTDYYYDAGAGDFNTTVPAGIGKSDFKKLELTVTWGSGDSGLEFQIDENTQTSGQLGSGSIRITDVVSSLPTVASGKVALGSTGDMSYSPPVDYNPGANPDIVSIQLAANKFKESTTPLPDIIRTDELVETTFDVVTYSQDTAGATFLRREQFRAVSCVCSMRVPDSTGGGLRPTLWEGYDYTEGEFVSKPYGESANNQQSQYCDICCRDHHDGGSGENDDSDDYDPGSSLFNPFRSEEGYHSDGSLKDDHKHYNRNQQGELELAALNGDTYLEACRMIRKDGFWRIAQDLRQEGLNAFPADYLDSESEVDVYSGYVTAAILAYDAEIAGADQYELDPPLLKKPSEMSPALIFPASTSGNPTLFPTAGGDTEQQLRTRGVYLDYLSDTLRKRINCLKPGGSGPDCEDLGVTSVLEIMPFYDVQLTWLARWNETPDNNPVDVTNQAIENSNSHSRGLAKMTSGFRDSKIDSAIHTGNLGLTGTDPIDLEYSSDEETYYLYALAIASGTPPDLSGEELSGDIISSVNGLKVSDVEIEAQNAQCGRTNTGYKCALEDLQGADAILRVFNYSLGQQRLVACSEDLPMKGTHEHVSVNGVGNWTKFILPILGATDVHIVIKADSC
jgi:type IV pilus modification protein PilV